MEDIVLVFYGNRNIDNYQMLNEILLSIKDEEEVPLLIFSLVSNDKISAVIKIREHLRKYLDSSIKLYKQFYECGYIENEDIFDEISGKLAQMLYYIKELSNSYNIKKIYFIDESELLHEIMNIYANMEHIENKFITIQTKPEEHVEEIGKLIKRRIKETQL